jgi:hypothetical protein
MTLIMILVNMAFETDLSAKLKLSERKLEITLPEMGTPTLEGHASQKLGGKGAL